MDLYDGESECEINNTSSSRDFAALAARFTSLQPYLVILNQAHQQQHSCSISFSNPRAVRQLFYAICQVEFSLKMNVPLKSMIPGIDNRLAYLEWIQKELNININNNADSAAANKRIRALDIGTGASCIYPLLAVKHLFPLVEWTATGKSLYSIYQIIS